MAQINTSKLTGAALDWAVAKCEGRDPTIGGAFGGIVFADLKPRQLRAEYEPSTNWAQGGSIIEREGINVLLRYGSLPPNHVHDTWDALIKPEFYTSGRPESGIKKEVTASGPTPLIAAMRCYVASKLGDEVEAPDELVEGIKP